MVEMENNQWELVLERFQDKVDKIKELEKERLNLAKETSKLAIDNTKLELENTKLKKELESNEATMKTILETLNEALSTMESYGLTTKRHRVDASALDIIV